MAKIDTSKIPGYAEMSAEDKLKALEAFEYDDNAAEVERLKGAVSRPIPKPQGGRRSTMSCLPKTSARSRKTLTLSPT